jgi:hypothetical protein
MAIWYILWSFGILYGKFGNFYGHLVYFVTIWYIFPRFGMLYQENSGNPDSVYLLHFNDFDYHGCQEVDR